MGIYLSWRFPVWFLFAVPADCYLGESINAPYQPTPVDNKCTTGQAITHLAGRPTQWCGNRRKRTVTEALGYLPHCPAGFPLSYPCARVSGAKYDQPFSIRSR